MSSSEDCIFVAYGCGRITQTVLRIFLEDHQLKIRSISSAAPVIAFDVELQPPKNLATLERWLARPHTLSNGSVVHFARVDRPYAGVFAEGLDHDQLTTDGYSLPLLGQLSVEGYTSFLLHAIREGRYDTARALADAGACIDPKYEAAHLDKYPLWTAVLRGDLDELRRRIDAGDSVDQAPQGGKARRWSPLTLCAYLGRHEMAAILLNNGANPNGVVSELVRPIVAAAAADDVRMVPLLADRGANVLVRADSESDIVPTAIRRASLNVLDYLINERGLELTEERVRSCCMNRNCEENMSKVLQHINSQAATEIQPLIIAEQPADDEFDLEPFGETVVVHFDWPHPAEHVTVRGSWGNWSDEDEIVLELVDGHHQLDFAMPIAFMPCEYKYIVDGVWCHNMEQPTIESSLDSGNVINNLLALEAE